MDLNIKLSCENEHWVMLQKRFQHNKNATWIFGHVTLFINKEKAHQSSLIFIPIAKIKRPFKIHIYKNV